jgi:hypothetical protein
LQRRIILPLIYFESGISTHYQGRRDYILVSKHLLSIEGVSGIPLSFCIVVRLDVYRPPGAFYCLFWQIFHLVRQDQVLLVIAIHFVRKTSVAPNMRNEV